jgi:hypothetical protein
MNWLHRLRLWLTGDTPDPAWTPQTPVQKFTGYDQDLARQGYERSLRRAGITEFPVRRARRAPAEKTTPEPEPDAPA